MTGKRRKVILTTIITIPILLIAAGWGFWIIAPFYAEDPLELLKKQTPCRIYQDDAEQVVWIERTYDVQWRFPVSVSEIPKKTIDTILAAEDADFMSHSGVDYCAVLRALWQNVTHGRIVSGASTISMQLAGLSDDMTRERSLTRKLRQAIRARRMEQLHSKEVILEEYVNRIPFGGKVYGIEAAARKYFGLRADLLTVGETAMLCGLPQRPNAYRPDKYPERALQRRDRVLTMLAKRGFITDKELLEYKKEVPRLTGRNNYDFERLADPGENIFYFHQAKKQAAGKYVIHTALSMEMQLLCMETLREHIANKNGPTDAACLLIDNHTGEIKAMIGSIDRQAPGGEVNTVFCRRTAGSVLKPFIYREAIRAGILVPDTVMQDTPVRFSNYTPGNANGTFQGEVSAMDALSQSLNTTAIRLTAQLGINRISSVFNELGLVEDAKKEADKNGLALALGTAGHTLYDVAKAYTTFTGPMLTPSFLRHEDKLERIPDPASAVTAYMLRQNQIPNSDIPISWKTGTSTGGRDSWCAAFTEEYTIVVWTGRKDGTAIPGLTGLNSAAECAGAIMQGLYHKRTPAPMPDPGDKQYFAIQPLCRKTGLRAGHACKETFPGLTATGIPLQFCRKCKVEKKMEKTASVRILYPKAGEYKADESGQVTFILSGEPGRIHWFVDDSFWGEMDSGAPVTLGKGKHTVTAVSVDHPEDPAASIILFVE